MCACTDCLQGDDTQQERKHLVYIQMHESALLHEVACLCSGKYPALPESLSADARDLLHRILVVDPEDRITIEEISSHAWYLPPAGVSCTNVRFNATFCLACTAHFGVPVHLCWDVDCQLGKAAPE